MPGKEKTRIVVLWVAAFCLALGLDAFGQTSRAKVRAWGNNQWGQCNVPSPNSYFWAIAAGDGFSLGLRGGPSPGDSFIVAWGKNDWGQCDPPSGPGGFSGFCQIAAGSQHGLGYPDGMIYAWGRNDFGECDVPLPMKAFIPWPRATSIVLGSKPTARSSRGGIAI